MTAAAPLERRALIPPAIVLGLAVTGLVFWIGYDGGSYGLGSRSTLAIGFLWAIVVGVGLGLLPASRPPRVALVTAGLLASFACFTLASTAWSASAERTLAEFDRAALYLAVLCLAVLAGTPASAAWVCDGIAAGVSGVAVVALLSRFFPDAVSPGDVATLLPTAHSRLSYPVNYWNGLAILLALALPLLLRAALAERALLWRGLALSPVPAIAAAIYLASSRGGGATAIVATVAFIALVSRRSAATAALAVAAAGSAAAIAVLERRPELVNPPLGAGAPGSLGRDAAILLLAVCLATACAWALACPLADRAALPRRAGVALATGTIVAAVAGIVAVEPVRQLEKFKQAPAFPALGERDFVQSHLFSANGNGRWQFWETALDEFATRPLGGRGAGSYEAWWAQHGDLQAFVRDAHSLYLETLGELGVLGLALLGAAFAVGIGCGLRRLSTARGEQRSLLAALGAGFLAYAAAAGIDWMWELTAVSVLGVCFLGLLTGSATGPPLDPYARRAALRPWWRLAVGLVGIALVLAQAIPYLAHLQIGESQAAVRRGDSAAARSAALAARDLEPWAASPYLQLALVEEQAGNVGAAGGWIREAVERDRLDWRLWLVRSRIELKAGRIAAARRSFDRAVSLNPRSPLFREGG